MVEIKFSQTENLITKQYDEVLKNKIEIFRQSTKTKKAIWLVTLTSYGLKNGMYNGTHQNEITMGVFF